MPADTFEPAAIQQRIESLTEEVSSLRKERHASNSAANQSALSVALELKTIQLTLAEQDKMAVNNSQQLARKMEEITKVVFDHEGKPGLLTRVDRIEQSRLAEAQDRRDEREVDQEKTQTYRKAMLGMVGSLLVGAISAACWYFFMGRFPGIK